MGRQYISYNRYEEMLCFLLSVIIMIIVELPNDFTSMQEEIDRQKAALMDKGKRKETVEVSGKDFLNNKRS